MRHGHGVASDCSSSTGQVNGDILLGLSCRLGSESVCGLIAVHSSVPGNPLERDDVSLITQLVQWSPDLSSKLRCLGRWALLQQL